MRFVVAIAFIAVATFSFSQIDRPKNMDSLLLENIEALAAEESDVNARCIGYGSIVCPINKVGVAHVYTYYSLPHY